jgi:uncharacterized protein YllA (UPF0747 family)
MNSMTNILAKTALDGSDDRSRLFLAYAGDLGLGLPPWLPGISSDKSYWLELADSVGRGAGDSRPTSWETVIDDVYGLSARLGAGDEVLAKLRGSKPGETLFVVTGQQPGALGGALLAVYKAVTAVALAAHLEGLIGRPCVPLYWSGGDDADFQEIRGFSCLAYDTTPFGSSMTQTAHAAGMPTGDIALEWPRQIWDGIQQFVGGFENGGFVQSVVTESFKRARDNGELASAVLIGLTGGKLSVVDGRSETVRRHAGRLFAEYVEDEAGVKDEITRQGIELDAAGYHAQLVPGSDSGVFLLEDGIRKNVSEDLRPRLKDEIHRAVENCSPGVALRNLVQDYVFRPVAVVLGPAEIAYRAQIGGLYERFGILRPAAIPRMTATYFPPALASVLAALGEHNDISVEAALTNPSEFAKKVYEKSVPRAAAEAARELNERVNDAVEQFSQSIGEGASPKSLGKLRSRLGDLRNRTVQATSAVGEIGKAMAVEQWPFLPELEAIIRPARKPQERSLSTLVPFLFGGESATDDLLSAARGYTDDLLDGRAFHVVYSSK